MAHEKSVREWQLTSMLGCWILASAGIKTSPQELSPYDETGKPKQGSGEVRRTISDGSRMLRYLGIGDNKK